MLNLILIAVAVILLTILIVWVIDKFMPRKFKPVLMILLWVLIAFLGYKTFMSVYGEIKFNEIKEKRYAAAIDKLIDIRDSQLAYKEVTGKYTASFDELVKFIDTAKFTITQRKDSTIIDKEKTRLYGGVEFKKDIVVVDTLGYAPVKDSLFKTSNRYKTMMNVPFAKEGTKFTMNAGQIGEDIKTPVFEAFVLKRDILHDQQEDFVIKENLVQSVEAVNGNAIRVGSMEDVKTNGNWPQTYGNTKK
ncbi:hypothetical protein [Lacinutrix salivirga]